MAAPLTPFRIQKFLGGLRYPARKDQVLEQARQRGADEQVIGALATLPDGAYESPISLSRQIRRPAAP
jgi:hypothetical protein